MTYSAKKMLSLRPEKEMYLSTFLIALATAAAFFIPFIIYDKGYFLFYGDFNVQQIPFYQMCHEMVKSGEIGWNWSTDLGVNFVGSYSFYLLGSPFFWLTIPFPNSVVPYLIGPLLILKFACSALTAYMYIRRFTRKPETARLCSVLYAFSGFSVYNIFFNHFHEAIIVFPLLLLSIELLLTENRRGPFAIMVCVAAITNYFFFFGMVVFCVIYWIVRVCSGSYKLTLSRVFCFFFEAVLGLVLSAILLLPSIAAISGNTRLDEILLGWNGLMYGKEQIYANIIEVFFFPPDIPARPVYFPGADVKWSSLGGWLPLFSMVGVFAYIQAKKGNWLRRILLIVTFMALVPILNSAFYMFNQSYYARWYYMPILLMTLATAYALEDRSIDWKSAYKWVLGITIAFTLVIGFFPDTDEEGNIIFGVFTEPNNPMYIARFWGSCAIAIVSLVVLGVLLKQYKKDSRTFLKNATVIVCVISVIYACVFIGCGKSHGYDSKGIMIDQLLEGEVELGQSDDNVFRIDVYDGVDNTGMYLDLYSINCFHSIVPASVTEFYEYIGEDRGVASRPTTDSYAARGLLSCKYLLNRDEGDDFEGDDGTKMPFWSYYDFQDGYSIYSNDCYIPFGFTYEYYMTKEECESYSDADRANMMLKAILLSDEQIEKYSSVLKSLSDDYSINYTDYSKEDIIIDYESYRDDCIALAKTATGRFEKNNNGFTYEYNSQKENLVFFSVPYDEGWSATVNGKAVEIEKVNVGFMAVPVEEGENDIAFVYKTPLQVEGIIITVVSLIIFIAYILVFRRIEKHHSFSDEYPEGDELISVWKAYDIDDASEIAEAKADEYVLPQFDIINKKDTQENREDDDNLGFFNVDI